MLQVALTRGVQSTTLEPTQNTSMPQQARSSIAVHWSARLASKTTLDPEPLDFQRESLCVCPRLSETSRPTLASSSTGGTRATNSTPSQSSAHQRPWSSATSSSTPLRSTTQRTHSAKKPTILSTWRCGRGGRRARRRLGPAMGLGYAKMRAINFKATNRRNIIRLNTTFVPLTLG